MDVVRLEDLGHPDEGMSSLAATQGGADTAEVKGRGLELE